ncbi:MAG TPA: hypothetical protein VHR47_13940, partial [Bacillota bacterium]|nr:hypothetical protein [Bacillota bacterium]
MLKTHNHADLIWEFPKTGIVRIPTSSWIRNGKDLLPVSSLTIHEEEAALSYDHDRITLTMNFEYHPAVSMVIQKIAIKVHRPTAKLLLDLQFEPELPDALNWLTIPGLFYGDNNLSADRVKYPKDIKANWSFRADASPCPGIHLPGERFGYAVFLANDHIDYQGQSPLKAGIDDVMGIGWEVSPIGWRQARFTYPCQEIPYRYHRPDKLERPIEPRFHSEAGDEFQFRIYHFLTEPGRQGYFKPVRMMAERNRPERLDQRQQRARIGKTAALFLECMRDAHFVPGV